MGLGLVHDLRGHGLDVAHELGAVELALLHLAQLVFPLAGEFGRAELVNAQARDLVDQAQALLRDHQIALIAFDVLVADEAFNDGGARGRGAQAALAHGFRKLFVFQQLARRLHGGKQGGFVESCRRAGDFFVHFHPVRDRLFIAVVGHQQLGVGLAVGGGFFGGLLAVHGEPAGFLEHLALGLEGVDLNPGDARGDFEFRRREEHRDEAAGDHVEELLLGFRQFLRRDLAGGDDGKVVADLAGVEHALVGPHPAVAQGGGGVRDQVKGQRVVLAVAVAGEGLHRIHHGAEVVIGQVARVGTGIGQDFELLVQGLGDLQGAPGAEAEAVAGLALQAGQIIEQGRDLAGGPGDFGDDAGLALAAGGDGIGLGLVPEALGTLVLVGLVLLESLVEPAAVVIASLDAEGAMHLKISARHEHLDLPLAGGQNAQRRGLHTAGRGEAEAAVA